MSIDATMLATLTQVDNSTLQERVYRALRQAILEGRFSPGEALPSRSLAGVLGTSVMPVRDALVRLRAEGGVEILPNRAARIPIMSRQSIAELYEIRLNLEGLATALATTVRTRKKQSTAFWIASLLGSLLVVGYGFAKSGWVFSHADFLLLAAAAVCGVGYSEGAQLGAEIGTQRLSCLMPLAAVPAAVRPMMLPTTAVLVELVP